MLAQPGALPGGRWAALASDSDFPLLFAGPVAVALVFPDGRLPSPRWRRVPAAMIAIFALAIVFAAVSPGPLDPPYEDVSSPAPQLPGSVWEPLALPVFLSLLACLVAAIGAVRIRYRRGTGIERLQIRWFSYAAALTPLTMAACLAFGLGEESSGGAFLVGLFVVLMAVPVAVGVAVLRYRLYDIDRIINRTVVYAVLTALLVGAWAATALLLGVALGRGSAWATAGATLVAATAFRPLRALVQDLVDRRFDRRRYDALHRVEAFLEELREDRAAPEGIRDVLAESLGDSGLEVAFWLPESGVHADAAGRTVEPQAGPGRAATPITRGGAPLAMVVHDEALADRPTLLDSVLQAAGLAIEIARLRVELRRQLAEVEASRERIVTAGYEERRRIERDLHDGAQQRLVAVGLALRHLQHELPPSANGVGAGIDEAVGQVGQAVNDLRELARGVRPTRLDEGLGSALRELAQRSPVPVEIEVTAERFAGEIEAAAYFVASEALTNAAKHAGATRVALHAGEEDGRLIVRVSDDGCGGARKHAGSGLAGLEDRVAAHGGRLQVTSPPGRGTTIAAELPCTS